MSCEKNRGAFVAHVAGGGSAAAQAFGGANDAGAALETIFDTARAQAAPSNLAQQTLATAKTRLLFEWMKRSGFTPPTHSPSGLPKADAQFGYAAMYDTIAALRDGKALPALAAQIVDSFGQTRALSAIRVDAALARLRCGSCGRFAPSEASGKPPHFCPNTATPETFQRALIRRLGVPPGAYPTHRLAELLAAANAGSVPMRHPVTNEPLAASLDSLPLALTQGFVPDAWQGDTGLALIAVSNGRIAPVLDATGLTRVALPETMLAAAAVGSGTLLALARSMLVSPAPISATMITAPPAGDPPTVSGGTAYDAGRFIGTEFRKSKGTLVSAGGHTYTVGDRSDDPADWGLARREGIVAEPPTRGAFRGIAVGRTLVAAAEILRVGSVIQRADQVIELYTNGALVSLYDYTGPHELHTELAQIG